MEAGETLETDAVAQNSPLNYAKNNNNVIKNIDDRELELIEKNLNLNEKVFQSLQLNFRLSLMNYYYYNLSHQSNRFQ